MVGQANFQSLQHCALLMLQVKELMLQVVVAQLLFVAEASIFSVHTALEVTVSIFSSYSLVRLIFPCRGRKNTPSLNSSSAGE